MRASLKSASDELDAVTASERVMSQVRVRDQRIRPRIRRIRRKQETNGTRAVTNEDKANGRVIVSCVGKESTRRTETPAFLRGHHPYPSSTLDSSSAMRALLRFSHGERTGSEPARNAAAAI